MVTEVLERKPEVDVDALKRELLKLLMRDKDVREALAYVLEHGVSSQPARENRKVYI
jgi:hypothetical protein